jgi:hypothetical protein
MTELLTKLPSWFFAADRNPFKHEEERQNQGETTK